MIVVIQYQEEYDHFGPFDSEKQALDFAEKTLKSYHKWAPKATALVTGLTAPDLAPGLMEWNALISYAMCSLSIIIDATAPHPGAKDPDLVGALNKLATLRKETTDVPAKRS